MLNPTTSPQTVTVTLLGLGVTRTLAVPARGRVAEELGAWGAKGDFGVEVACGSTCAASVTMWDQPFKVAHESIPMAGCVVR